MIFSFPRASCRHSIGILSDCEIGIDAATTLEQYRDKPNLNINVCTYTKEQGLREIAFQSCASLISCCSGATVVMSWLTKQLNFLSVLVHCCEELVFSWSACSRPHSINLQLSTNSTSDCWICCIETHSFIHQFYLTPNHRYLLYLGSAVHPIHGCLEPHSLSVGAGGSPHLYPFTPSRKAPTTS